MKIGIMTFPNSVSFGATLQMCALYKALERLGVQPEIINYQNAYMKAEHHTSAIRKAGSGNKKLRYAARRLLHCKQYCAFRRFEKQMNMYPGVSVESPEMLPVIAQRYEGIICGSDQVWNPWITGEDTSFFLDFCGPETKRIAYAPSFGVTELPGEFQSRIKSELEKFSSISVREEEGAALLKKMLGNSVPLVLDPTFLLDKEDWVKLEQEHPAAKGEYILYFTVFSSESLLMFCKKLAEKTNLKIVVVGGNVVRQLKNRDNKMEYAWDLSPGQWLYLIHHANCVVTNSFHGTAFSIHYQKDFFIEPAPSANSRLEQILRISGLEDRVVAECNDDLERRINYSKVLERLAPEKIKSANYLRNSIR